jgi:hypothetical protein
MEEMRKLVCDQRPTWEIWNYVTKTTKASGSTLTLRLRRKMFIALLRVNSFWAWPVYCSACDLIKSLEDVLMTRASIYVNDSGDEIRPLQPAALGQFVGDVVVMARILCTENVDAEAEFVSERIESWKRRWEDCTPMDSVSELEGWAGCLIEELTGEFVKRRFITFAQMFNGVHCYRAGDPYELNEGTMDLFPVDVIDAGIVERRGPFRFVPTTELDQHLTFTSDNRIFIYENWGKYLWMANSELFHKEGGRSNREIHRALYTYLERHRVIQRYGFEGAWDLGLDLARIHFLLFYRSFSSSKPRFGNRVFFDRILGILAMRRTQLRGPQIASRLGCKEMFEQIDPWNPGVIKLWTQWERFMFPHIERGSITDIASPVFHKRLVALNSRLRSWKPETVLELRYQGYGGVDPITLYAYYAALAFGVFSVIAVCLGAIQVYLSAKALNSLRV